LNNLGVDGLLAGIREHETYLKGSGRLQGKILLQSRQRLVDALEDQVIHQIVEEGFERFGISQRIEDIALRRIDPYSIVAELLSHFRME